MHVLRKSKPFFTVCESTRYGPTCSLECADSCVNNTCNNYTGSCMYGCQEGFYGYQCDRDCYSCPTGCDRITGECIGDCPVGRFGKICNKTCSKDCKNRCNKNNGSCVEGCVPGNFWDFCNETCDDRCFSCCESRTENSKNILIFEKKKPAIFQTYLLFFILRCWMLTMSNVDFTVKPMQDSCTENLSFLIGVCVVLCISVVVNGCTITW